MDINQLKKKGLILELEGAPYEIISAEHSRSGRGGAFVRTKLKNLISGQTLQKTFDGSNKVEEANVEWKKAKFIYKDGDKFYFMDAISYEQFFLSEKLLERESKFLKQGLEVKILYFQEQPVNIKLPKKVELEVTQAPPAIKGDSATTPNKTVTLETGLEINTPIFISQGDKVIINTEKEEYVERA